MGDHFFDLAGPNFEQILNFQISRRRRLDGYDHGNGFDHDCCGSTTAAITTLTMVTIAAAMATIAAAMDEEEETSGSRAWGCGMATDFNQDISPPSTHTHHRHDVREVIAMAARCEYLLPGQSLAILMD